MELVPCMELQAGSAVWHDEVAGVHTLNSLLVLAAKLGLGPCAAPRVEREAEHLAIRGLAGGLLTSLAAVSSCLTAAGAASSCLLARERVYQHVKGPPVAALGQAWRLAWEHVVSENNLQHVLHLVIVEGGLPSRRPPCVGLAHSREVVAHHSCPVLLAPIGDVLRKTEFKHNSFKPNWYSSLSALKQSSKPKKVCNFLYQIKAYRWG